ncbi:hypothetical protein BOTBODRAFT_50600 [Botryobasidium botryosum FD-172 SS1]|uniref:Small-subunit processome Utp12 domain-containing protein n=1 Tax=Botryobasidium botryosum (strain FD-172 SS1) TaxID=930990 RepID=A0A067MY20_BOTB1|nr:hypothetical protein BOTBODRAFT_50600 [Botryobasidium botryosum FD-172 SS1]
MVRSYLRHGGTKAFGLVCSATSNSAYDGKHAYVPALEDVLVWDVKKGDMMAMWHETGHRSEVSCILQSPQKDMFAVGYMDGSIRLWSASTENVVVAFNGHKKAVTALAFDDQGARLASGSQDTELIVWDVLAETGLYRLRGHRDQITAIRFISTPTSPSTSTSPTPGYILTSSKDTFLKLWDLSTQHCVQTVVAHRAEIWCLELDQGGDILFTGSGEGEVKAWRIDGEALTSGLKENENGELTKMIHPLASLPLSVRHRVTQITFHPSQPLLAIQSHDRSVEIFRVRTEEEVKKKQARRQKREKEKGKAKKKGEAQEMVDAKSEEESVGLVDLFTPYLVVRASGKIRSFSFVDEERGPKGGVQIFTALASNALEIYSIPLPERSHKKETPEATRLHSLDLPGHRTDVRTLCLSTDDQLLASASNGSLKVWNMRTSACIRTLECGYAICSTFLPGNCHIAVGTKSGEILLYDVASSALIETVKAHEGAVWSIDVKPDGRGIVSGSADKDVKFWELDTKKSDGQNNDKTKIPTIVHVKTLKMTDDVLAVKYSPDGRLLAVSLLDATVKVFCQDTLKFFLSLYGHKLPVLSLDISSDSKLIVTCSADKNVKIWGLDFGDCHKSMFAHEESVMQVAFERSDPGEHSHYFWTVGKDRMVKYWDGDKFEMIQRLDGHHGEIWALAVSNRGSFVVTGSHDRSIRVWEKTDEPLFLAEERERELEDLYESGLADTLNKTDARIGSGVEGAEGQDQQNGGEAEVAGVTKQTVDTLMAGEKILEALDAADAERAAAREYEELKLKMPDPPLPPPRHAFMAALDLGPEEYVLYVVQKVSNAALYDALLVLPFGKVVSLLGYLNEWAIRHWNIPLVSRILFFLLKTHHHQIVSNRTMRTVLIPLRTHLRAALRREKDEIGYNLAALKFLQRRVVASRTAEFYGEAIETGGELDEAKVREMIAEGKKRKRVSLKA